MNTIMNHELVHMATMDQPAARDRAFRRLFGGKVVPLAEHPESILYFYLTAPRVAAPRWYQEGIAVFVDTWMAGGLGRAQSGYDEMVFRTMVRDGAPFPRPARPGVGRDEGRLSARDQLVPLRHEVHDLARPSILAGAGDCLDVAPRWQPRLLLGAVPPGLRRHARRRLESMG